MSMNYKVRKKISLFQFGFSGISDFGYRNFPHEYRSIITSYIIGHNYHGHYLHAGGFSVNNYVRENKVREVNVRE